MLPSKEMEGWSSKPYNQQTGLPQTPPYPQNWYPYSKPSAYPRGGRKPVKFKITSRHEINKMPPPETEGKLPRNDPPKIKGNPKIIKSQDK